MRLNLPPDVVATIKTRATPFGKPSRAPRPHASSLTRASHCLCFPQADWQPTPARRQPSGGAQKEPLLPPPKDPTKKCLVLDLDETLVHSSFQAVRADAGVSFFTIPVEIEHSIHDINVIRRPGLDECAHKQSFSDQSSAGMSWICADRLRRDCRFLRAVGGIYEVVIFTASLAKYANPVCDTIDSKLTSNLSLLVISKPFS